MCRHVKLPKACNLMGDSGDDPIESPHPVFGKKPGLWERIFWDKDTRFWPTRRQACEYARYRERCKTNPLLCRGRAQYDHVSAEVARRLEVRDFVRQQLAAAEPDRPEWWELL